MSKFDNIQLGDMVSLPLYPHTEADLHIGKIVYIHPRRYYFTVEYTTERGSVIRESFIPRGARISCCEGTDPSGA